jgi:fructoselysine-6-P-deglycase FrlB-like protein
VTPVFTSKLNRLGETVTLAVQAEHRGLAAALQACSTLPILAVGSGGSAIAAEFLAACRTGLGHPPTAVVTPMAYVLEAASAPGTHAWLFSATGENQDILAAFDAAVVEHGVGIDLVTSNLEGALATAAASATGRRSPMPRVHFAPVADPKDGFLATHSIVSAAASLILAADHLTGAVTRAERTARLADAAVRCLSTEVRADLRVRQLDGLAGRDILFLLHDPHLAAAAVLIETSLWEAGICAIQCTDFRNFAHGRHVWLARHPNRTFVLALTCERSRAAWAGIRDELPIEVSSAHLDFGRAGRGGLFEAILTSLTVVEVAGAQKGVDPGTPGVAKFGRRIFERADLRAIAGREDAATRRKRRAEARVDPPGREPTDWPKCRNRFAAALAEAEIRAVVLDYDGTMVTTPERLNPPGRDILDALIRLADHGLLVGFATGRGGSVGGTLRAHFPARLHGNILVGYYNGAFIVPLEHNIEKRLPAPDAAISAMHKRLCAEAGLFVDGWCPKNGALQITIPFDQLVTPMEGVERIATIVEALGDDDTKSARVRMLRSGHSVDICPAWASKLRVVVEARRILDDATASVLRVGDSGDCQGNDYELLADAFGLSVDRVCYRDDSCWNPLPSGVSGPDGLARILIALRPLPYGRARFDLSYLFTF